MTRDDANMIGIVNSGVQKREQSLTSEIRHQRAVHTASDLNVLLERTLSCRSKKQNRVMQELTNQKNQDFV